MRASIRRHRAGLLILMLLASLACGELWAADDAQQQLRLLREQRQALEQGFNLEREHCEERFAVNDCLNDVRLRRNAALQPLQQQEDELAARIRRAKSVAQRERVRERQQEAALAEGERRTSALRSTVLRGESADPAASAAAAAQAPRLRRSLPAMSPGETAWVRQQQAEREAQRHVQQRLLQQQRLQQHQLDVQQRRAQNGKKPAAPLPLPTAEEISALSGKPPVAASKPR